jgi:hypothetical protein
LQLVKKFPAFIETESSLPHSQVPAIGPYPEPARALLFVNKEVGLEVNADKTEYMVMSRDQNAGRSYNMKNDISSIERVEEFKYLGTKLTEQNCIVEDIKSRMKLGNACYYSVHYPLSSNLPSKNLKIDVYTEL